MKYIGAFLYAGGFVSSNFMTYRRCLENEKVALRTRPYTTRLRAGTASFVSSFVWPVLVPFWIAENLDDRLNTPAK